MLGVFPFPGVPGTLLEPSQEVAAPPPEPPFLPLFTEVEDSPAPPPPPVDVIVVSPVPERDESEPLLPC